MSRSPDRGDTDRGELSRRVFLARSLRLGAGSALLMSGCNPAAAPAQNSTPPVAVPATTPLLGTPTSTTSAASTTLTRTAKTTTPLVFHRSAFRPDLFQKYLDQYNQIYAENATFEGVAANYAPTTETRLIGGAEYDVLHADEGYPAKWYSAGFLQDLEGLPDIDAHKADLIESLKPLLSSAAGKLLGLPSFATVRTFFYNQAVLDKAGLKPAETWDELFTQCQAMKRNGISAYPFVPLWTKTFDVISWMFISQCFSEGMKAADLFDADFNPVYQNHPVAAQVLDFNRRIFDAQLTPPDILTIDHNATLNVFSTGDSAYFFFNTEHLNALNDASKSKAAGQVRPMLWPGSAHGTQISVQAYTLGAKTKDRTRAWNLLRYLAGKDRGGKFVVPKEMMAIQLGYSWGYKSMYDDADIKRAWSTWADTEALATVQNQFELASSTGPVVAQPWYADWQSNMATELQAAIGGQKSAADALKDSAEFARRKKVALSPLTFG